MVKNNKHSTANQIGELVSDSNPSLMEKVPTVGPVALGVGNYQMNIGGKNTIVTPTGVYEVGPAGYNNSKGPYRG